MITILKQKIKNFNYKEIRIIYAVTFFRGNSDIIIQICFRNQKNYLGKSIKRKNASKI